MVIVTQLPFVALYERLVKALGRVYFEHGYIVLEVIQSKLIHHMNGKSNNNPLCNSLCDYMCI